MIKFYIADSPRFAGFHFMDVALCYFTPLRSCWPSIHRPSVSSVHGQGTHLGGVRSHHAHTRGQAGARGRDVVWHVEMGLAAGGEPGATEPPKQILTTVRKRSAVKKSRWILIINPLSGLIDVYWQTVVALKWTTYILIITIKRHLSSSISLLSAKFSHFLEILSETCVRLKLLLSTFCVVRTINHYHCRCPRNVIIYVITAGSDSFGALMDNALH